MPSSRQEIVEDLRRDEVRPMDKNLRIKLWSLMLQKLKHTANDLSQEQSEELGLFCQAMVAQLKIRWIKFFIYFCSKAELLIKIFRFHRFQLLLF
jgi:hypothetical protein